MKELLEDLVERGVGPEQKRLFIIDGSKALRTTINAVFGTNQPVQIMGYRELWASKAILNGSKSATRQAVA